MIFKLFGHTVYYIYDMLTFSRPATLTEDSFLKFSFECEARKMTMIILHVFYKKRLGRIPVTSCQALMDIHVRIFLHPFTVYFFYTVSVVNVRQTLNSYFFFFFRFIIYYVCVINIFRKYVDSGVEWRSILCIIVTVGVTRCTVPYPAECKEQIKRNPIFYKKYLHIPT